MFVDTLVLQGAILLPLLGALFVLIMPGNDRVTLRHVGMASAVMSGLLVVRALFSPDDVLNAILVLPGIDLDIALRLDAIRLPVALTIVVVTPMALRAGTPRAGDRTKSHTSVVLLIISSHLFAVFATSPLISLVALNVGGLALAFLTGLFGGPHKTSVALKVSVATVAFDLCGVVGLLLPAGVAPTFVVDLLLLAPLAARAGAFPMGVLIADLVEQGSVTALSVSRTVTLPAAALWWAAGGHATPHSDAGAAIVFAFVAASLFGALGTIVVRDLRRFISEASTSIDAIPILALLLCDRVGTIRALSFLCLSGLAASGLAFAIDAIERRLFTRDSVELVGCSTQVPGLFRVVMVAILAMIPIPGLGAGVLLVDVTADAARAVERLLNPALAPNTGMFVVAFLLLMLAVVGVGASMVLRRLATPPRTVLRAPAPFSLGHAARVWTPVVVVIVFGFIAGHWVTSLSASGVSP